MVYEEKKFKFFADRAQISGVIKGIKDWLVEKKADSKSAMRACIKTEDILSAMIDKAAPETQVKLTVYKLFGTTTIHVSAAGEPLSTDDIEENLVLGIEDEDTRMALQKIYQTALRDKTVTVSHKKGLNIANIKVEDSPQKSLYRILASILLGAVGGLVFKNLLDPSGIEILQNYLISPFMTMFMNALKMMIGPVIFFSISSSMAGFSDLKTLGKWATKIVSLFLFTAFVTFGLTVAVNLALPTGDPSLVAMVQSTQSLNETATQQDSSVLKIILGIIPNNLLSPFKDMEMLQIIFVSVLSGIVSASLSENYGGFASFLRTGSAVATKAISLIMKFMPLMIFAAMVKLFMTIDVACFVSLLGLFGIMMLMAVIMLSIYLIIVSLYLKKSIKQLISTSFPIAITAFSTESSCATMPTNLKVTTERMHIDSKLASLGISLGATIHMDGTIIMLVSAAIFVANMYGVAITPDFLIALMLTVIPLAVGAPGVPNAALVVMIMTIMAVGMPGDAVSILMGIYPIASRFLTVVNTVTDMLGTSIIAKSENAIHN